VVVQVPPTTAVAVERTSLAPGSADAAGSGIESVWVVLFALGCLVAGVVRAMSRTVRRR
jgi:hypothetical protein